MGVPDVETDAAPRRVRAGRYRPLRWAVTIGVLVAIGWFARGFDFARLRSALRAADWPLVALAAALNLTLNSAARTMRWRALLDDDPRTGRPIAFWTLASILLESQAMNNVLPFRVGEAVRTIGVNERTGHPVRTAIAAQVAEKPVEIASLALVGLPIVLSPRTSGMLASRWWLLVGIVAGAAAILAVLRRLRLGPEAGDGWLRRSARQLALAIRTVDRPRAAWLASLAWALASDVVDIATVALCAVAVGIDAGPAAWCAVLVAVNIAIAVPSAPAQVGVHEAGAVLVLLSLGVDRERALAFALLYHGVHLLPSTLAGGAALATRTVRERKLRETT
jgi:uncharacterized membrane protein YbhN (UPF0104 family)